MRESHSLMGSEADIPGAVLAVRGVGDEGGHAGPFGIVNSTSTAYPQGIHKNWEYLTPAGWGLGPNLPSIIESRECIMLRWRAMKKYPYKSVIALDMGIMAADADVLAGKVRQIVEAAGGTVANVDKIGSHRLAFRVKGRNDANHMIVNFDSPAKAVAEAEAWLRLQPGVLRVMTTRRTVLETMAVQQPPADAGPAS